MEALDDHVTKQRSGQGSITGQENTDTKRESRLLPTLSGSMADVTTLAIQTGMRKSELLNLRWPDVDFTTDTIVVNEAKSGEGRRLPMNSAARAILVRLRDAAWTAP